MENLRLRAVFIDSSQEQNALLRFVAVSSVTDDPSDYNVKNSKKVVVP